MARIPDNYPDWALLPTNAPQYGRMMRRFSMSRTAAQATRQCRERWPFARLLAMMLLAISLFVSIVYAGGLLVGTSSASARLDRRLRAVKGSPWDVEFDVRLHGGRELQERGFYSEAVHHFEASWRLAARRGGDRRQARALRALGEAQLLQGRSEAAKRSLDLARELLEQGNVTKPDALRFHVLRLLGNRERDLGQTKAASEQYELARSFASSPEEEAKLNAEIGETLGREGRLDEAARLLKRVLATQAEILAAKSAMESRVEDESALAATKTTLADVQLGLGKAEEALQLYSEASSSQQRFGGLFPNHPERIAALMGLARARRDLGRLRGWGGAVVTASTAEQHLRVGSGEGPDLSRVLLLKADLLRESGDLQSAERHARASLAAQRSVFDAERPETATARLVLGGILHDGHRLREAREQYEGALHLFERVLGPEHPEAALAHNAMGTLFVDLEDYQSAEQALQRCLDIQLAALGADGPGVSNTYNNLAALHFRLGQPERAAVLLEQALDYLDRVGVSVDNPERSLYTENLRAARAALEKLPDSQLLEKLAALEEPPESQPATRGGSEAVEPSVQNV